MPRSAGFTPYALFRALLPAIFLAGAAGVVALTIGAVPVPFADLARALVDPSSPFGSIIRDVRLPRVLLAACVGAGLSVSGNTLQVMLRNPLAEPYILGISNGCAVGVIVGSMLHMSHIGLAAAGFVGGLAVSTIVFRWAARRGALSAESLLLTGVMIGALGAALIFLAISFSGDVMRGTLSWLLGNLSLGTWSDVSIASVVVVAGSVLLVSRAHALNALAVGDEFAHQAGIDVKRTQTISYMATSLIVGTLVALVGAVGFVGLVVPHIVRRFTGPDNRIVIPVTFFAGAAFVIGADLVSRTVVPGGELPIGAVTALIGAPLFLYILRRR